MSEIVATPREGLCTGHLVVINGCTRCGFVFEDLALEDEPLTFTATFPNGIHEEVQFCDDECYEKFRDGWEAWQRIESPQAIAETMQDVRA
jgi:hypothetical protein